MGKFINHNKYSIQISGPNREIIRMSPGEQKELSDYFRKYCPKYIKESGDGPKHGVLRPIKPAPSRGVIRKTTRKLPNKSHRHTINKTRNSTIPKPQIVAKIFTPTVENIGIGILSCNRLRCIKRLLESIQAHSPKNINVVVSDESTDVKVKEYLRSISWITLLDHKERKGVVHNTNHLLHALMSYEYKLILNDDVEIKSNDWEKFYFKAMNDSGFHHFCYREYSLYGANAQNEVTQKVNHTEIKTIRTKPQGAVLAFDNLAFKTVGYYDHKFPKYGMAHVDWSNRVSISNIQRPGFHDVSGSEKYFKIHSEKTVDENKTQNLKKAREIYDSLSKLKNRIFVNDEEPISNKNLLIWINTHNRSGSLDTLLSQIVENKKSHNIKILIFDDGSTEPYGKIINKFKETLNIAYEKLPHRGKKMYWDLCTHAMSKIKNEHADYYYWIPDDVNLCNNFFDVSIRMWENITDRQKICLNLLADRVNQKNWTNKLPESSGFGKYEFWRTYWMDCCAIMDKKFFESLEFKIPKVSPLRWKKDPTKSSGVGEHISKTLFQNFAFYQVKNSLLIHGQHKSKMNPEERKINALKTNTVYEEDSADQITFSMATMPARIECLKQVIESIYDQADQLEIYLNNFDSVPGFLNDSKIKIHMSKDHGDLGDAGKFFCCENVEGYHLTIDDDIIYPPDYASALIEGVEKYNRQYLVGIHASIFKDNFVNYRKSRTQYHCKSALESDLAVHMLGTGTLCYHTDTVKLKRNIFEHPNMADTWLSRYCQENKLGCIALKRPAGWIKLIDIPVSETIYGMGVNGKSKAWDIQNSVLKQIKFKIYGRTK